jgi:GT2 family glycosyltransferase
MEGLPNTQLDRDWLAERIGAHAGAALVRDAIREEMVACAATPPRRSLTIAICTKDRPEWLQRCLSSVRALLRSDEVSDVEVLVVDNASSSERPRKVAEAMKDIRYVAEPRPGLDFARNRALHASTSDWIAFLDDDVVVDRGWLNGLVEAWSEHPDAAAVTGLILPYALETRAQQLFEANGGFRRGFSKVRYHGPSMPGNPLYPLGAGIFGAGANMAFRRDVLLTLGGFDEALDTGAPLPGGGDLDIFYRVLRAGHALVYEPTALVFHEHRRAMDALRRQYESWGRGFLAFLEKVERGEPEQQAKVKAMRRWWFKHNSRRLVSSVLGLHVLPPSMILAELRGGLRGLSGEYERSHERSDAIRRRFASRNIPPESMS